MTHFNVTHDPRLGDTPLTDSAGVHTREPVTVRRGGARVSYLPGDRVELVLDFGPHFVITGAGPGRDLLACLTAVFGPSPAVAA